ncbi:phosphopantetheine-binding protein, partial [Streptomyces stramineus]
TLLPAHLTTHHTPTPPLLQNLTTTTHHHTPTTNRPSAPARPLRPLRTLLMDQAPAEQLHTLLTLVQSNAATVLGHSHTDDVTPDTLFRDQGFDSLTAIELRNRLNGATELRLPSTLVFDYPTPAELAEHLKTEILQNNGPTSITSALAELDRLEAFLTAFEQDDAARSRITTRLQSMLLHWNGPGNSSDAASTSGTLASATASEVLDFIDNDLGLA